MNISIVYLLLNTKVMLGLMMMKILICKKSYKDEIMIKRYMMGWKKGDLKMDNNISML